MFMLHDAIAGPEWRADRSHNPPHRQEGSRRDHTQSLFLGCLHSLGELGGLALGRQVVGQFTVTLMADRGNEAVVDELVGAVDVEDDLGVEHTLTQQFGGGCLLAGEGTDLGRGDGRLGIEGTELPHGQDDVLATVGPLRLAGWLLGVDRLAVEAHGLALRGGVWLGLLGGGLLGDLLGSLLSNLLGDLTGGLNGRGGDDLGGGDFGGGVHVHAPVGRVAWSASGLSGLARSSTRQHQSTPGFCLCTQESGHFSNFS